MHHPSRRWLSKYVVAAAIATVAACADAPTVPPGDDAESAEVTFNRTKKTGSAGDTAGGSATTQGWTKICDSYGNCVYYNDGGGDDCEPDTAVRECSAEGGSGGR